jgi:L-seryl-tRNA(Ser) seleniumtransferase
MAKEVITTPRDFPSVEELLQEKRLESVVSLVPRPIAADAIRDAVAAAKEQLIADGNPLPFDRMYLAIIAALTRAARREIGRVINATGILVHTNLGRAPISETLFDSVKDVVTGYGNLEFNLQTGERGSRGEACEAYLAKLTEAESSVVVNNCAAALFLILNTFANRKGVVISRGELVQIGGGFRIPDILRKSGAKLTEVGTSNITTPSDYEQALGTRSALILKVHKSNFVQAGFTDEVPVRSLVQLGIKHKIPVVHDLGSGLVVSAQAAIGYIEATVQGSIRDGAGLVCFSGDKMFGGVQAGIIVGHRQYTAQLKKNPLYRALRVDKITFAMIERLARAYLEGSWQSDIKLWTLSLTSIDDLRRRAEQIVKACGHPTGVSVVDTEAYMGGGALPEATLKSAAIRVATSQSVAGLMKRLRSLKPPVVSRVEDNCLMLDLKAVDPSEDEHLVAALKTMFS